MANAVPTALRPPRNWVGAALWTAVLTLLGYLAWMGWDQPHVPLGDFDSPPIYQGWQYLGLGITLALVTGVVTWYSDMWVALVVVPATLTLAYSADSLRDGIWYWPFEAGSLGVASFLIMLGVSANVRIIRRARTDRVRHSHSPSLHI